MWVLKAQLWSPDLLASVSPNKIVENLLKRLMVRINGEGCHLWPAGSVLAQVGVLAAIDNINIYP